MPAGQIVESGKLAWLSHVEAAAVAPHADEGGIMNMDMFNTCEHKVTDLPEDLLTEFRDDPDSIWSKDGFRVARVFRHDPDKSHPWYVSSLQASDGAPDRERATPRHTSTGGFKSREEASLEARRIADGEICGVEFASYRHRDYRRTEIHAWLMEDRFDEKQKEIMRRELKQLLDFDGLVER